MRFDYELILKDVGYSVTILAEDDGEVNEIWMDLESDEKSLGETHPYIFAALKKEAERVISEAFCDNEPTYTDLMSDSEVQVIMHDHYRGVWS